MTDVRQASQMGRRVREACDEGWRGCSRGEGCRCEGVVQGAMEPGSRRGDNDWRAT
jgi:hypothetical protein